MKISEIQISYTASKLRLKVTESRVVYNLFIDNWNPDTIELYEEFKVLLLNRNNQVLGIHVTSKGGIAGTVVDPKIIFSVALKAAASSIIFCHNHPSGNLKPSHVDIELTKKLVKAGGLLDIKVLDHLIVSKKGYWSFADEGMI